ncbi:hypothetical protein J4573_50275 [Actinomadura barringtoniae]|uniref:Uncharacterized protein n=1 Tax=Actinomadura barringtoniae TaxID=1427535 RepID=A0A939PN72_9ACTN|nr:hypothetical protein [Actinomadura barringtoniae]MBO2455345.1 hypothetical protein [Actinomadura barringtoniae]
MLADSGFRAPKDGFSFANYGKSDGVGAPTNLTVVELRKLFGDSVCGYIDQSACHLSDAADRWMRHKNKGMDGGHCYGMAMASELLRERKLDPQTFRGATTPALRLPRNDALQRQIAYNFAFQWLPSVVSKRVTGTPNQVTDKLIKALTRNNPERYALGVLQAGEGGHEVTPYAVRDNRNGTYSILVYDNNFPNEERAVLVDRKADTWRYNTTTNPNNPVGAWSGTSKTQTMDFDPISPGLGVQPSPFDDTRGTAGKRQEDADPTEYYVDNADGARLLLTDDSGRRTGYQGGKYYNEIPGARVDYPRVGTTSGSEPDYYIPDGVHVKVTLDATDMDDPADNATVGVIGDGYEYTVSGIHLKPGDKQTLDPGTDGTKLSYTTTSAQKPTIEFGVKDAPDSHTFTVAADVQGGGTFTAELPLQGDAFSLTSSKPGSVGTYTVTVERTDSKGERTAKSATFTLNPGQKATLSFAAWDDGGKLPAAVITGP